jgi:hypothetical protein
MTAAFANADGGYEFYVVVGRPGEPIDSTSTTTPTGGGGEPSPPYGRGSVTVDPRTLGDGRPPGAVTSDDDLPMITTGNYTGVSVLRYTSADLVSYDGPVEVLYLENGSGKNKTQLGDGSVWTVKSMDRDGDGPEAHYVLLASFGAAVHRWVVGFKKWETSQAPPPPPPS